MQTSQGSNVLTSHRKPDFLIVGAPKCATTSLYYYLKQHPDIFMPEDPAWKEPKFFGRDQQIAAHKCIRNKSDYLKLFSNAGTDQRVGEASPTYLHSTTAAEEIKSFNPDMRIIVSLRNPVDLVISMHYQNLATHNEDLFDLEEALRAEGDRRLGKRIPRYARHPPLLEYSRLVKFSENLERYFQAFGRDNVLVIFFDDIKSDIQGVFSKLLTFLDVSPNITGIDFSPKNESKSKSLRNWRIRGFMDYHPRISASLRKIVPHKITHAIANVVSGVATHERPEISQELRTQLLRHFHPEVENLSALLGKDLTHWSDSNSL